MNRQELVAKVCFEALKDESIEAEAMAMALRRATEFMGLERQQEFCNGVADITMKMAREEMAEDA